MAKINELAGVLTALADKLDKAKQEIVDEVAALKAALQNVEIPADAAASLDRLNATAQALDNLNPDPTPAPAPEAPPA